MRRVPRKHRNPVVRRERNWRALRRQIVLLACGLTVACGFVLAVGQHYAAVRYGYDGERLREERKALLAERDRLLLELSAAESPVTLERAARDLGMQPARPSQIGGARPKSAVPESAQPGAGARPAADGRARTDARDAAKGTRAKQTAAGDEAAGDEAGRGGPAGNRVVPAGERAAPARVDSRPRVVEAANAKGR